MIGRVSIALLLVVSLLTGNIITGCTSTPEETALRHVDQALTLIKQGRNNEAITECNKAIEVDSNLPEAYNIRGIAYAELGQLEQAVANFGEAIRLNPQLADAYINRGFTYKYLGKKDEAIADFKKFITLSDNPQAIDEAERNIAELSKDEESNDKWITYENSQCGYTVSYTIGWTIDDSAGPYSVRIHRIEPPLALIQILVFKEELSLEEVVDMYVSEYVYKFQGEDIISRESSEDWDWIVTYRFSVADKEMIGEAYFLDTPHYPYVITWEAETKTEMQDVCQAIIKTFSLSPVPSPSPESATASRIAYMSDRDGLGEIYVMDADGSNQIRLTNHPAYDSAPAWSPDGKQIAFVSERNGDPEIYVMDADGSNKIRLTNNPSYELQPAWSPDGKRIAYALFPDGPGEIYVMDADGSNQHNLTNNPANDVRPSWSPDGKQIIFHSERDGNAEIYVMDSDGSNQKRLTNNFGQDAWAAWSPDGKHIVFSSERDGNAEIYVMDSDGSNPTRLTNQPEHTCWWPSWSPDGMHIAYAVQTGQAGDWHYEIWIMDTDGSNSACLVPSDSDGGYPAWSP